MKSQKIINNTIFLYIRMVIVTVISLYSVRIVLSSLGVVNFGIYNLVSNVIALSTFLNGAIVLSTQRCITYSVGSKKFDINKVYNTALSQLILISLIFLIFLSLLSKYFFDGFLNIPLNEIDSAKFAYYMAVITVVVNIIGSVNLAIISANEDFYFETIISIFTSISQLAIAFLINYTDGNKLEIYSLFMALLAVIMQCVRFTFVYINYKYCRKINFSIDKLIFKELFYYNKWNSFGAAAGTLRNSGISVLLNLFFGPVSNAAYGVANQVNSKLKEFSLNLISAITPQILKSEASGERDRMLLLSTYASKYGLLLLSLPALPLFFEMHYVLDLWLKTTPDSAVYFCQMILIFSLINMSTVGLQTTIQALGNIKYYQIVVGGFVLLTLPVAYVLLKFKYPDYIVFYVMIFVELIAGTFRIYFIKIRGGLKYFNYVKKAIVIPTLCIVPSVISLYLIHIKMNESIERLFCSTIVSVVLSLIMIYFLGMESNEKKAINKLIKKYKVSGKK
ncbi:hypothetical protein [Photobacterium sp. GB-210]|uniref:hypothetical protein n=1 Tax=Photobacterium sp. GB-210 TaxID=2022104 RepID=UPI000D153239|nr:hypothetical protein [Photobacterium sp. GB-210]PSV39775.1 hypothetical protein C9J38_04380 [Photobacterium sp. GB-210]